MYFHWLESHANFDYSRTMLNFEEQGNIETLSEAEKELFLKSYRKIPGHPSEEGIGQALGQLSNHIIRPNWIKDVKKTWEVNKLPPVE